MKLTLLMYEGFSKGKLSMFVGSYGIKNASIVM